MKILYEIVATNLKLAQERGDPQKQPPPTKLQPGDTVVIQNHTKGPFDPKYIGDYRVVSLKGNQVEIQPAKGGLTEMKHMKHIKHVLPADKYINQLPNYSKFGRKTTLRINPDQILDLHWKLAHTYHTTNIGQVSITDHHVHDVAFTTPVNTNCIILNTKTHTIKVDVNLLSAAFYLLPKFKMYHLYPIGDMAHTKQNTQKSCLGMTINSHGC